MKCTKCNKDSRITSLIKEITLYERQQNFNYKFILCPTCNAILIQYLLDQMPMSDYNNVVKQFGKKSSK